MTAKRILVLALVAASFLPRARADITTGLVGQWEFDDGPGSSTAVDLSGDGNNGTLTGFSDATFSNMWVTGRFGDAILFNTNGETTDYVSVPDSASLRSFGSGATSNRMMTLAAWVKLSVPGGAQSNNAPIITKGTVGAEQFFLGMSNGLFQCEVHNSTGKSGQIVNSTFSPQANIWYHVVAVWWANPQEHYLYIDGQFNNMYSGSGFLTSAFNTNYPLTIGNREVTPGAGFTLPFQGVIDDVRVFNRVLTPGDIYQLYTNGATIANAPTIITQPRSITAYTGDTATFAAAFDPSFTLLPAGYQWRFNSTNISGVTGSSLTITNIQGTNAGVYSVVITNFEGTATSSNAVLTVQSLPTANVSNNIVGYWKFDDGSGTSTAADSSTNHNTGVLAGFTDTTYTSMWTNGILNGALAFNGDGSGSNVVAVPNTNTAAPAVLDFSANPVFTISAWVNAPSTQTNGAVIIAKGTGGGQEYLLDVNGSAYRFFVRDAGGVTYAAQTSVSPNGQWQLVTGELNAINGTMNCYVNNQLGASTIAPFSLMSNQTEFTIGNNRAANGNYQNDLTGIIDDVRIYNRDLTSADVAALYAERPAPLSVTWQTNVFDIVAGTTAQLAPIIQGGVPPLGYQWQLNGSNIFGATKYPLILTNVGAAAAGSYDVIVSDSNLVPTVTSTTAVVTIEPYLTFNSNGVTWSAQGSSTPTVWQGTNIAQLTPLQSVQSNSVFYDFPLYIGGFQASFNYQVTQVPSGTTGPGDGLTFCIQTDPRGPSAIAYSGNGLGVGNIPGPPQTLAITPSVEFEFNINSANAALTGISWDTNGALGPVLSTAPLQLDNGSSGPGDIINAVFNYQNGVATVTLTDTNAGMEFAITNEMDIPGLLGSDLGYIGFTASTGSGYAAQQISNFSFQSLVNLSITTSGASAVITWPTGVGGYVLQENSSLSATNWINSTNVISTVNGTNKVSVPLSGAAQFFQLVLPTQ
jgi:hypothetical protein